MSGLEEEDDDAVVNRGVLSPTLSLSQSVTLVANLSSPKSARVHM